MGPWSMSNSLFFSLTQIAYQRMLIKEFTSLVKGFQQRVLYYGVDLLISGEEIQ